MKNLKANWFTEGLLNFEYKKYLLLAWLQHVQGEFNDSKLYPSLSDLVFHYNNLHQFREGQASLTKLIPEPLSGELDELHSIVNFSIPELRLHIENGKSLFEHIESAIHIEPIGISPLYKREGYLLIYAAPKRQVDTYDYSISFFENVNENYYGIRMTHIDSFEKNMVNTFEAIKINLHRNQRKYDNPATYLVSTSLAIPSEASLIPVTKRKFLAYMRIADA
jgi:hypothetical protein